MSDTATPVAAAGISYSAQVDEKRSIVFQTHIPLDSPEGYYNEIVSKFQRAACKQQAYHEIYHLKRELKVRRQQLASLNEDVLRIDRQEANKVVLGGSTRAKAKASDNELKNNHQQQVARENAVATLKHAEDHILRLENEVKEQEAIYNADAGSTDRDAGNPDS